MGRLHSDQAVRAQAERMLADPRARTKMLAALHHWLQLGHVEDLSIDKLTGQVRYALISFGGFLGVGARVHPVPWEVLDYEPALEGYVVPLTREALEKAPSYLKDELEGFGDGDKIYRDSLFSYYGQYGAMPYWGL